MYSDYVLFLEFYKFMRFCFVEVDVMSLIPSIVSVIVYSVSSGVIVSVTWELYFSFS